MIVIPIVVATTFAVLGLLHFYWAIFGIKNPELVLPTKSSKEKVSLPSSFMTTMVGLGLLLFALVFANSAFQFWSVGWLHYFQIAVGIIFLVRAIGDFKYAGFFKSVKGTPFAKMDTKYYAPLCLVLAILIAISVLIA
ncbi:DUF3995 domain-containing protein [Allomuricauda sp. d1]|uniref:DUF3995 domain-containing protein n=1 Tax=Allomuricauda sp. d1 TaxID=3136725 RepID=UPI0031D3C83B